MAEHTFGHRVVGFVPRKDSPIAGFRSYADDWWKANRNGIERYDDEHYGTDIRSTLHAIMRSFRRGLHNPGLIEDIFSGFLLEEAEAAEPHSRTEKRILELAGAVLRAEEDAHPF